MHSAVFSKKDFGADASAAAVGESEGVEADDVGEVKVSGCTGGGVWDGLGEAEAESVLDGADEEGDCWLDEVSAIVALSEDCEGVEVMEGTS